MKIPIEVLITKKVLPLLDDQSKEIQNLLSLPDLDFLIKLVLNPQIFKHQINSHILFELFNRLDSYLELIINNNQENKENQYQKYLNNILQALQNIISIKINRSLFRSLDRLLQILRMTNDLSSIQNSLNIIILFFNNREGTFKDYEYFEDKIGELMNLVKIYMLHKNVNSKEEIKLCDYFRDDPGYERYLKNIKQGSKEININYNNNLEFDFIYPSYQTASYSEQKFISYQEPKLLEIKFNDVRQQFQNQNSMQVAQEIMKSMNQFHQIDLKQDSPFFDAIQYRVAMCQNFHNINFRMQIVKTSMIAFQAYVILRKTFEIQKQALLEQIYPFVPDYLLSFKDILQLLYFDLEPKFHIGILKISSMILQVDENFDFSVFMSEITTHFSFIQKVYKDCTFLQVQNNQLCAINYQVLNPQIAIQHEFLNELLLFLKKTCKNLIKDEQSHTLTNSIYKISTIMNSILRIIELPYINGNISIFTIENQILVIDILSLLIPKSQEILRDFNIIDKIMIKFDQDFNLLAKNQNLIIFKNQTQIEVEKKEQIQLLAHMLKLLSQPFVRKTQIAHTMTAPTLARKIADSNVLIQCSQILRIVENDIDLLFSNFMILSGDIMQEVPQLIDTLIENGVLHSILQQLSNKIPRDAETIPNVIYFINMYCLVDRGRQLESQYNIIGKTLDILAQKEYIEILSTNKGQLKGKCLDSISMEICELMNFVDLLKDPVLDNLQILSQKILKKVDNFTQNLESYLLNGKQIHEDGDNFVVQEHELLLKMIINYSKFYSKLFNQRSVIVKNLIDSNIFNDFINLITNPVVILSDQCKVIWQSNRYIIQEAKYVDTNLTSSLNQRLQNVLEKNDFLFKSTCQNIQDFVQMKKLGFKYFLENQNNLKIEIYQNLCNLGQIEFLIDFICMVKFTKDIKENMYFLQKLTNIYLNLIQNQFFEEQYIQQMQLEISDSKKQNLLIGIRKYFIVSIKNIPTLEKKNEQNVIRQFSNLISKLLLNLQMNDDKINQKYVEHASDLLQSYNEIFKRTGKMNPWILIILQTQGSMQRFIDFACFYLQSYDESKQTTINNIAQLIKHLFFIQQDLTINIEISDKQSIDKYINTIYFNQITLLQQLLQVILEKSDFSAQNYKQLFDVLFDRFKRLNSLLGDQQETKPKSRFEMMQQEMSSENVAIQEQLLQMGFTQTQAEIALQHIDYPDINLATEWILSQPEETFKDTQQQPVQENIQNQEIQIQPLEKQDFKQQVLNSMNFIARMLVYQIYEFQNQSAQIAEFILNIIQFQPNIDAKKLFFFEISYIVMASIKQIVSSKKTKFKIGMKGRAEILQMLNEKKLIKENSNEDKISKVNTLLTLFLRISLQAEYDIKYNILSSKLIQEFMKYLESLESPDQNNSQFFLLILKLLFEFINSSQDHEQNLPIINFLINAFQKPIINKESLEGSIQILNSILLKDQSNIDTFLKSKGLQFLLQCKCNEAFPGFLQSFCQLINTLIENQELIQWTIENEMKFLFSNNKQQIEFDQFLKYFQKYSKSKLFLEILESQCHIVVENKVKKVQLKQNLIQQKTQFKLSSQINDVLNLLIENCLNDLQLFLENKQRNVFSINLILKSIHVIIRQFPVLIKSILNFNCSKFAKKNPSLQLKQTNLTFLQVLIRTVVYFTEDKLRNIIFEICLDNNNNNNQKNRQTVLQEIYDILQIEIKSANFMKDQTSIHNFTVYSSLHIFLLPIREITKLSLRDEMNFIKLYSDAFLRINIKSYYNFENVIPFILEPLSVLNQYAYNIVLNKVDKNNENWILNQLMPSKLLIKHQNMVDDWVGLPKSSAHDNQFYQNLIFRAENENIDNDEYDHLENYNIQQEIENPQDDYDENSEDIPIDDENDNSQEEDENNDDNSQDEENSQDEDDSQEDEDDDDDDDDDIGSISHIESSNTYNEMEQEDINDDQLEIENPAYSSEESGDQQEGEDEEFSSNTSSFVSDEEDDFQSEEEFNNQYIEIEDHRQQKDKKIKLDQDLGQIVNLSFLTQIDQELIKINQNMGQFFQKNLQMKQEGELQNQIKKLYQEIEENSNLILQKGVENQWTFFESPQQQQPTQNLFQSRNLISDWHIEDEPLEIQGHQFVFQNDRQEYLPFQINQVLQNAFRGANYRIISTNSDISRSENRIQGRYFANQQQQRIRDQEEQQNFRNLLLERLETQELQQPQQVQQEQPQQEQPQQQQIQQEQIQQQQVQQEQQIQQQQVQQEQQIQQQQIQEEQQIQQQQVQQQQIQEEQQIQQQQVQQIQQEQQIQLQQQEQPQQEQPQQQNEQMEIEGINFEDLGLPSNFLELNSIDPQIFNGLSDELKMEIIMEFLPRDEQPPQQIQQIQQQEQVNQENQNLAFINSLSANLREEILLTSDDVFLQTLPQEIQQEAQQLREQHRGNRFQYMDLNRNLNREINREVQTNRNKQKRKKSKVPVENQKQLLKTKDIGKLMVVADNFIEQLINLLYLDDLSFGKFPFELLKTLIQHPQNEFRILDALVYSLTPYKKQIDNFPLNIIIARDIIKQNFNEVYQQVSIKTLYVFNKCCHQNVISFFLDPIENKKSIQKVEQLKEPQQATTPFMFLNDLFKEKILVSNDENLEYMVSFLNTIVKKAVNNNESLVFQFKMTPSRVNSICSILSNSDDVIMKKLSYVISVFCYEKENLDLFINELKITLLNLSQQLNNCLEKNLKSLKIQENQMEIENSQTDALVIAKIENEFDDEIKMQKIFKLIKQLLESYNQESNEISEIRQSFQSLINGEQLNNLWINVSEFLISLYQTFSKSINIVNPLVHKLTPILECFFIIYKIAIEEQNKEKKEKHLIQIQEIEEELNPIGIERSFSQMRKEKMELEEFFQLISEKNRKFINLMVKQNINILNDSLSLIIKKAPHLLDFENKKLFFKAKLKQNRQRQYSGQIRIKVRRNDIFKDSYSQLSNRKGSEMQGKLFIQFSGEEGMDAGGLTREWFLLLSKEIFNPNYALFMPSATNNTFQPSPYSKINPDHLRFFKFVGRFIAKALNDGYMLDAYFTRAFYKHILGQPLSISDMEDIDPTYYKNLKWILDNDISAFDLTFSYESDEFGYHVIKDLIPNGQNISVTQENKQEYVKQVCHVKMGKDIEAQLKAFLEGFHELIPSNVISIFNSKELELMISGLPDIDIQDLKNNTEYNGYNQNSQIIRNFWEILENFDKQEKAGFIQFVTGTSKVPLEGFSQLKGMGGVLQKFMIHKAFDTSKLPTSHTCFNQLDLPNYSTKEILKEKLLFAINEGKEGFGFV